MTIRWMTSRGVELLVAWSVVLVAGCMPDSRASVGDAVVVGDTNGVRYVGLGPLPGAGAVGRLEDVMSTRGRADLFRVGSARLLPDGSVAIANRGTSEIVVVDTSGAVVRRIGRKGEGPGEFQDITALNVDDAGRLVAYDARLGRLTTLTADGGVVETRRLAPPNRTVDLYPLSLLDDGGVLAVYGELRIFAAGGERRDTTPLFRFAADGGVTDTLGLWPGREWSFIGFEGGSARAEIGFGRTLAFAGRTGIAALGSTDSLDVSVFDASGRRVRRITGGGPGRPVSADALARWHTDQAAKSENAPDAIRQALADAPHRETYPAFESLVVDDAGRVWIGSYAPPGSADRTWVIVSPSGDIDGPLAVPVGTRILDAAAGRVVLLRRNEVDEEFVAIARVVGG